MTKLLIASAVIALIASVLLTPLITKKARRWSVEEGYRIFFLLEPLF